MQRYNKLRRKTSFQEFCKCSSLQSFKYLQERNKGVFHMLLWICINTLFISVTTYLILTLWRRLIETPLVISLETTNYPITEMPFPAISVCDINKISKRKAELMTNLISNRTGIDTAEIWKYMRVLGGMYEYNMDVQIQQQLEFQKILENASLICPYKTIDFMKQLAPSCEELLTECTWKRQNVDCKRLFQMRLTYEGFCCVFNYVKKTIEVAHETIKEVERGEEGLENGLQVIINNQVEDYFYSIQSSLGTNIHIFDPYDYPDKNSGGLKKHLVNIATEFLVSIDVTYLRTHKEAIKIPIERRGCYFSSEKETQFGFYSHSDCIVGCRTRSMLALCGCVPFTVPINNRTLICELSDLPCLNKFKLMWKTIAPTTLEDTIAESFYGLRCTPICYPKCNSVLYQVNTNFAPLKNPTYENKSVLRVYYKKRVGSLYVQDVVYYWFEILRVFALMVGFSMLSVIEVLLYIVVSIYSSMLMKI